MYVVYEKHRGQKDKQRKPQPGSLKTLHVLACAEAPRGQELVPAPGTVGSRLCSWTEARAGGPSRSNARSLPCLACRALMDEVEYDVTKARQEKTKVGSFRINPDGTQERRKVAEKKLCPRV